MTLGTFVRKNRPHWQRLETMLGVIETRGPQGTDRPFLRELSALYRATTAIWLSRRPTIAAPRCCSSSTNLVARAHNQIYRPHRFSIPIAGRFLFNEIPQAVRAHLQAVAWSAIIFLMGIALGLSAVQFDERAASIILPSSVLNSIYSGQMWTGGIFSVVPAPVAFHLSFHQQYLRGAAGVRRGLSFGLITAFILFQNGFMLGVAFKLCADYGLLGALFAFIAGHGILEISSIIIAGAGGFVLANALLNPGSYSRSDALAQQGRSAVRMAVACVPHVDHGRVHRGVYFAVAFSRSGSRSRWA